MYNNSVYFTNFPNPSELLCVFATINSPDDKHSCFNQIILKCRQLIFEKSEILACPETNRIYGIYIVVKEDFYKNGDLHTYLEKHSLRSGSAQAVQTCIFEKCCLYTIISKLAPKWNQISNYLVYGRNFLTNQFALDSVRLKFNINDKGYTTISINVSRVKISKIILDNLFLTDDELKELENYQSLRFKEYNSRSIQVLPSLKRGKIIALHLKLNKNCSIKTYPEMRRYWKNTYGYRLPETDENIFYVDISFFEGSQIFTYPNLCVGFYEPVSPHRIDPNPISKNFMTSLKKYVPTILGENYHVTDSRVNILPVSQMGSLPSSSEINTTKEIHEKSNSTNENNKLPNETKPKSKLSQLLEELNKNHINSTIYLTPKPLNNNFNYIDNNNEKEEPLIENTLQNHDDAQSKSISDNLKEQLDFLTTSISQRASSSKNSTPNVTSTNLKRNFKTPISSSINEKGKVPIKKRRIMSPSFLD